MDGAVANAFWSITRNSSSLKPPWETGPQAEVFKKRKRFNLEQDQLEPQHFVIGAPSLGDIGDSEPALPSSFNLLDSMKPLYSTCVKALAVKTFEEDRTQRPNCNPQMAFDFVEQLWGHKDRTGHS